MAANQIYSIVNSIANQAFGNTALTVVDEGDLIALGDTVLSSSTNTENFLNTLVQRIGKTIVSYRRYKSAFSGLVLSDMEYGNIVQKLKVSMPAAEADESYGLTDGYSVDHYKVAKPGVRQKLFTTETPYQLHVTIQRVHLKEAFLSGGAMESFISAIFGEVQNKIEVSLETLGRNAINNYIAECIYDKAIKVAGGDRPDIYEKVGRIVSLAYFSVGDFSAADEVYHAYTQNSGYIINNGDTFPPLLVADIAGTLFADNETMMREGIRRIKTVSKQFKFMSDYWNDGSVQRHTPLEDQRMYILSGVETAMETNVEFAAFHRELVSLEGFEEIPYFQSIRQPYGVYVKLASDNTITVDTTDLSGVTYTSGDDSATVYELPVAVLFDRDALGVFKRDMWTATTPFNAAGGYANTYWHMRDIWFNDMSENFIVFCLSGFSGGGPEPPSPGN